MMIRINLLPVAKRQVASSGGTQLWGVIYLLSAFAWGVVLFLVYLSFNGELEEQRAKNAEVEAQIEKVRKQSANIGDVSLAWVVNCQPCQVNITRNSSAKRLTITSSACPHRVPARAWGMKSMVMCS